MRRKITPVCFLILFLTTASIAWGQECVECHKKVTPGIVSDWQLSKHSRNAVTCSTCHGSAHQTAEDFAKAEIPTLGTCGACHEEQVRQFSRGKHALAWAAMKAMPTFHYQPMAITEGMKGCGGCHSLGVKTEAEIKQLKAEGNGFGLASCDACHTRHTFSLKEARQPQACETCHMGFDHPQWEMYSGSKHGVRYLLKQNGTLPATAAAPTCQTCHMPNGDHAVQTAWGFLAVRLPMPEDPQWAADRASILQALGVLYPDGKPTPRLEVVKGAKVVRLTQADWQKLRDQMITTCSQCHSGAFARGELAKSDELIKNSDHLMAEAIQIVAGLYRDGLLPKPKNYAYPFPDILTFHDAPTVIEQRLFVMFMEHRMRTFEGAFHASPDYAVWYGWSEMQRDLTEIKEMADDIRFKAKMAKK